MHQANINFEADVNSISTNNEQRDAHLKGADFFSAEKFPETQFPVNEIWETGEDEFELTGDLSIRDVTKQVTFTVGFAEAATDPVGTGKSRF